MKYIIVLGDGMADRPLDELGGKTPLAYADTPEMNRLAGVSVVGMVRTIPEGMSPGSDTANLSVLGYDPKRYYTGRSPLEALSIGVKMKDTDIALRCNFVTVSPGGAPYESKTMIDHSAGEISTEDAAVLLDAVKEVFENDTYRFYKGTSYRHLVIWDHGHIVPLTPPHDILGQAIGEYLPEDSKLREMQKKSFDVLSRHPLNEKRMRLGKNPANSLWFWGAGTAPRLSSFTSATHLKGAMISAVDLLKGIAVGTGMKVIDVPGANGGLDTNYEGKAEAAADALLKDGMDFVYIHLEAPDEMGHQGNAAKKVKSIENLDQRIIRPLTRILDGAGADYRMLIMPDHPTPVSVRTHTADPVPFMLYDSTDKKENVFEYTEKGAEQSGFFVENGYGMIELLLSDTK